MPLFTVYLFHYGVLDLPYTGVKIIETIASINSIPSEINNP